MVIMPMSKKSSVFLQTACIFVKKFVFGKYQIPPFLCLIVVHVIGRWMIFVDMSCCFVGG